MAAPRQQDYRIKQTQAQVDEVVGVMRDNMQKVLERDSKLGDLEDKADGLKEGANRFEKKSVKLKRKMQWKNMKMMLILVVVIAVLALIITLIVIKK
eukprot:m.221245 g.221245  ORF g.221245 m.221245 type:complete len:97 (-) comp10546_c0_seq1:96-386(-)